MSTPGSGGENRGATRLILRGYGPLAALVVVLLLVTLLVPSRPRQEASGVVGTGSSPIAAGQPAAGAATGKAPGGAPVEVGVPATGKAAPGKAGTGKSGAVTTAGSPGSPGAPGGPAAAGSADASGGVRAAKNCSGAKLQDGNSAYSPPCFAFSGANGGATARGVTGDTITVAIRDVGNLQGDSDPELAKSAEAKGIVPNPEAQARTRAALLEYFNSTYQLYGRKVELVTYKGRGDPLKELGGTGQESANADALKVGQEIKAFADLSAISQPYLDALVRQKVIAFGGLHLPQSYYSDRAPYAWGQLIDCTTLTNSAIDLIAKRLPPTGKAERAGSAGMREKQRSFGLIVPDDAVYAQCIDEARPKLKAAGITIAKEIRYSLELAKLQQEAPNIAAQLKNAGITTVLLVTDPILPFFLTGSATQQDYWPEWFLSGTVFTDVDVAGQFYDQDQWQFAYGQSYIADIAQGKASESYRAYKAIRPQDEPTLTRDLDYYSMLMLFIGLQMAGPDLNPATFQQGMFAYPGAVGPLGAWSWGPNDYTAIDDAREIYYDRRALSQFNNQPGRYISVSGNRRYRGTWPTRDPQAPIPPPAAP
ncbi:MAG: ABC transporter substrate-binding protein [Sporichthyaceae bacterium]